MLLRIVTRPLDPDIMVVVLDGKITMGPDSRPVERLVRDLLKDGKSKLILDLTSVDYVDSTGIGIIVSCLTAAVRAGGGLRVAGVAERVKELMKMTRLDSVLAFYPTPSAAAEGF